MLTNAEQIFVIKFCNKKLLHEYIIDISLKINTRIHGFIVDTYDFIIMMGILLLFIAIFRNLPLIFSN